MTQAMSVDCLSAGEFPVTLPKHILIKLRKRNDLSDTDTLMDDEFNAMNPWMF